MANRYRLVVPITLLLWVSALFVASMMRIWLCGGTAVTRWRHAATSAMLATVATGGSVSSIVLLIAFYGLSRVRTGPILTGIVSSACASASILLLILVLLFTLRIGSSGICILVCVPAGALLCCLIMTMLAILIQTVVVLVTLIRARLLTVFLSCRIVLCTPDVASGGRRIAFVLRIHCLRLECLCGWFSMFLEWFQYG